MDLELDLSTATLHFVSSTPMNLSTSVDYPVPDSTFVLSKSDHSGSAKSFLNDAPVDTFYSAPISSIDSTQLNNKATAVFNDVSHEIRIRTGHVHSLIDSTMQPTLKFKTGSDLGSRASVLQTSFRELLQSSMSTSLTDTLRPSTGFTVTSSMSKATKDLTEPINPVTVSDTLGNSHVLFESSCLLYKTVKTCIRFDTLWQ